LTENKKKSTEMNNTQKEEVQTSDGQSTEGNSKLARLLALSRPEWKILVIGTFFLLLGSAMGLLFPQAIRAIMDGALKQKNYEMINYASLIMLGIFTVQGFAVSMRSYLFTVAGERIVTNLRRDLYNKIVNQEIGFFDERRTGELTNRLASDTTVLQNTVSVNISMVLRNIASVVGGIGLLLYTSPILTALMLSVVPFVVIAAVIFGRQIRKLSRKVQDALAKSSEVAEETISGIRTVRAFSQEDAETERYDKNVQYSFELARRRAKATAIFGGAASFAAYGAIALVFWYGSRMVVQQQISIGELTAFILYTLIVAVAIGTLSSLWTDFMRAVGAGERVFELMDRRPKINNTGGERLEKIEGDIHFKDVHFSYPTRPDITVLKDLKLRIKPGEIVALVGPSGGGKSTIAALISRMYDPNSGEILLDRNPLKDLDASWLRKQVGVVAQEPILFSTSIAENIRYGREDASEEALKAAAKAANAHNFIEEFPEKYDTMVGERGVQLSGGQKQRVAIARAVLKDPSILILDEATSALDAESEHLVKEALDRLMEGRTTLVIAHRLSTVKDADRVLVIADGHIAQAGTHEELIQEDGIYHRLVEHQFVEA